MWSSHKVAGMKTYKGDYNLNHSSFGAFFITSFFLGNGHLIKRGIKKQQFKEELAVAKKKYIFQRHDTD